MAGCVSIPREKIEIERYSIDPPETIVKSDTTFDLTLFVQPFQGDAENRGDRILFREDQHTLNYYYYHRWIVPPEKNLTDILATTLTKWKMFGGGVFEQETGIVPTHEIHGRLLDLHAENGRKDRSAILEIKLTVIRIHPETYLHTPIFQKIYLVAEPRPNTSVESYITAVNNAVEQWLLLVRYDLEALFLQEAQLFNELRGKKQNYSQQRMEGDLR